MVVEGDAGRDDVDHRQPSVRDGGFHDGLQLLLVATEGAGDEGGTPFEGEGAAIEGWQIVDGAGLERGTEVRGGRELALGEAVNTIVFNDVDERHVAAHEVHELAQPDGGGIAVTGNPDPHERAVGEQRSGGDGRHAAVDAIEAVGEPEEVGRRLGRAADAAELGDGPGFDAEFVESFDNAFGNRVVAAPRAQRGLAALIIDNLQPDAVDLFGGGRRDGGAHLLALLFHDVVGAGARIQRQTAVVAHAAQFGDQIGVEFQDFCYYRGPAQPKRVGFDDLLADVGTIWRSGGRHLFFNDPNFLPGARRFERLRRFRDESGCAFTYFCQVSPNFLTDATLEPSRDTGCLGVVIGIENEALILGKAT